MYKAQAEFLLEAASKLSDKSISKKTDELIACLKKIKVISLFKRYLVILNNITNRMFGMYVNYV